ncbi:MAG: sulfatase [Planctomycetota bacterium]|nr:sulfatase [Planctomycetota bacterium]
MLKQFLLIGLILLALVALPINDLSAAEPVKLNIAKPNIIVILADDLGYSDLGFQGCKDIPTPHLDALAASGTRFTSGYVSGPYCSPTRAGLLTGRYQTRFGHEFNPGKFPAHSEVGLPLTEKTIADRLNAAGYATGMIGKGHLGLAPRFHPQKRGFDEFYGFLWGANEYLPAEKDGSIPNILRGTEPVRETAYLTDAFAREAVSFIDRHQKEPFFLYLSFNAVHTPMEANPERLEKFASIKDQRRRAYAAMTSAMDDAVGSVMAALKKDKLEEKTLIFFLSDNGGPSVVGTTLNGSNNLPLRGSKKQTLEGGVRVPFVVSWKGTVPAGQVLNQPIIQLDILPTALAAAGVDLSQSPELEGVNLLSLLTGKTKEPPHEALYWRFGDQMAIRRGKWKLVRYDADLRRTKSEQSTQDKPAAQLFDLENDIGETKDLASKHPEIVAELQAKWDKWNEKNVPAAWAERPAAVKKEGASKFTSPARGRGRRPSGG